MICPNCGNENTPERTSCSACGAQLAASPPPPPLPPQAAGHVASGGGYARAAEQGPKPPNHLVWAILATLFCCLPTGIAAIVFAAQVDGKYAAGDYAGAMQSSASAKTWSWVSFGIGAALVVMYLGLVMLGLLAGGYN